LSISHTIRPLLGIQNENIIFKKIMLARAQGMTMPARLWKEH